MTESSSSPGKGSRPVTVTFAGIPMLEGAGVRLRRVFGQAQASLFDPFLLLDHFRSGDPADYVAGFPWHPHRGIETVTYMLDGRVEHADSLGNAGTIDSGDLQWMSASSGILHQEMPQRKEGVLEGLQLWVNLPAGRKMAVPAYRDLRAGRIPKVPVPNGGQVRVVAGEYAGQQGPIRNIAANPTFLDVSLPQGASWEAPLPAEDNAFVYALEGRPRVGPGAGTELEEGQVGLLGTGDRVTLRAAHASSRALVIAGRPLHEPIAWYGPIVMNTQQQLAEALRELRLGTFVRDREPLQE